MAENAASNVAKETQAEFVARVAEKTNGGLCCIAIAMGIETGLFEVMIGLGGPKTCQEIAAAGNYKERYVREWLGSIVANGIVEYNADNGTYWLPAHRHCITGSVKTTALTMTVPILSTAFYDVAECFKRNGPSGVPYKKYTKFDELLTRINQPFFNDHLAQSVFPTMPKIYQQLQQGIQVLDIGCSEGISTRAIARAFPKSQVYGIDITETGIQRGKEMAKAEGLTNIHLLCMSVSALPVDWSGIFDLVFICNTLHDLPHPIESLHAIHRVLKIEGTLSVVDTPSYSKLEDNLVHVPHFSRDAYVRSMMNCVPTSLSVEGGAGLGSMWGREKAQEIMRAAHFEVISVSPVETQSSLHYQCQKA